MGGIAPEQERDPPNQLHKLAMIRANQLVRSLCTVPVEEAGIIASASSSLRLTVIRRYFLSVPDTIAS